MYHPTKEGILTEGDFFKFLRNSSERYIMETNDPRLKGGPAPGAKTPELTASNRGSKMTAEEAEAFLRQSNVPQARPGFRLVKELDHGESVVSMIEYQNRVWVATTKGVYRSNSRGDVLEPLLFEVEDRPAEAPGSTEGKSK